jgi:nucleoside-diphosphate-sugar epimerase
MPTAVVKAMAPLAPFARTCARIAGQPARDDPAADGVTYWATDAKARRELGYEARTLAQGMADLAGKS